MTTQTERGTCTGQGLVHVEHLTKHYRKTPALRDYSLSLDAGHIVGLMGPNGCGKTTLLKILAGVLSDYEGIVTIGGHAPGVGAREGAAAPGIARGASAAAPPSSVARRDGCGGSVPGAYRGRWVGLGL